jgi:3-dehydrosphinganine reductase
MRNNYLTSVYPAHTILKLWRQDDEKWDANQKNVAARTRQITFISRSAVFVNIPGYVAYTRKGLWQGILK